ncbi:PLD-like domain-containing protein [Halopelagius inordinatus]|uniref:PLD-like domain-containing protein n=1 Tax=Halopelagius inordinatus TaxID=553467 RepID=A0A1I2N9V8_9EURY|nr:phospholipase D-like domain-containing protein [Halopelagius inordinatus]SFG00705.1 PLD-like domain-containing protein [Halopelagius inordinatus]
MTSTSADLDSDALLETARIVAEAVPADALDGVRASLEYLHYADRAVRPDVLRDVAPCDLSMTEAENIVYQLAIEGILDDDHLNVEALRSAFVGARLLTAQTEPPENTIVATIPYDDPALDPGMFEPLHGNLLNLIRSADDDLVLMSPFLSERAYERLRPALHTATDNGASITLITRSLTYGETEYNRGFARAVHDDARLAPHTTTYEYIDDETWTTFHAKIVIADGQCAYLGTANLTHTGLGDNLELGVIFRDNTASRITALVENLRQSEFFHEVTASSDSFRRS